MKTAPRALFVFLLLTLAVTPLLQAGTIVVSNDEWMFANGYLNLNDDTQFAKNIASFTAGASGNILILSSNFGLTGSAYTGLLTAQGYNLTVTTNLPGSFAGYNAVFLAGGLPSNAGLNAALTSYVNGGGNVFLEAGTACCGGSAGEANYWNPFLNNFGLALNQSYNGVMGNINVSAFQSQGPNGPTLFNGVNAVYMNNGNDVMISGIGPGVQIFSDAHGNGLYGVYKSGVPEPASLLLLGSGLLGLAGAARRSLGR